MMKMHDSVPQSTTNCSIYDSHPITVFFTSKISQNYRFRKKSQMTFKVFLMSKVWHEKLYLYFFNNFDLQTKSINQSQIAQCEVTRITNLRSTSSSTQKLATNVTLNAIHICPCEKKTQSRPDDDELVSPILSNLVTKHFNTTF